MYIMINATYWQDRRDSSKKVTTLDDNHTGYRRFLINPNRISDLKVDGTGSSFLFSENHRDRRENNSFVRCTSTVAEIQAAHDTAFASNFITLPFYKKNNPHNDTVDYTLDVGDCAYFDDYNDPDHPNCCWLIYNRKAFKRVEQLVGYNLDQVEDVAETGTTTTTSTTTTEQ